MKRFPALVTTSTQDVFPPNRFVEGPGVAIDPRVPQNRSSKLKSSLCGILPSTLRHTLPKVRRPRLIHCAVYGHDLAHIQAAAFGTLAEGAAPEIIRRLRGAAIP